MGPHTEGLLYSVYMIRGRDGSVKVGVTQRPEKRLHNFRKETSMYLHAGMSRDFRTSGELPEMLILQTCKSRKVASRLEQLISGTLRVAGVVVINGEGRGVEKRILKTVIKSSPMATRR